MSNFLPLYQFPCIVPDTTSSNAVFLAGVTNERRLEINRVSLSNVNAPSNTLVMQHTNVSSLVPDVEKHCDIFVGDFVSGGAPFVISQFASAADILLEGSATVVRANGTIVPQENSFVRYTQPKLFSITGVSGKSLWYTAFAESPSDETGSAWFAIVIRDDGSRSSYSYKLSTFPTSTPLLSVGTYTTSAFLPITGHLSVFDVDGRGVVYTVSSRDYINNSTTIQTLSNPISINMNGIKLTPSAFPVTLGDKGFIIDKASSGGSILYSIQSDSRNVPELKAARVIGNVPPFRRYRSSANLGGTQIVLYGGWDDSDQPTNDFHVYDTITNLWVGPGLVAPPVPSHISAPGTGTGTGTNTYPTTQTNIGAIVGGSIAGLVGLGLATFFVLRTRRRHFSRQSESISDSGSSEGSDNRWKRLMDQPLLKTQQNHSQTHFRHPQANAEPGRGWLSLRSIPGSPQDLSLHSPTLTSTSSLTITENLPYLNIQENHTASSNVNSRRNPQVALDPSIQPFEPYSPPRSNPQSIPIPPLPFPPVSQPRYNP